MQLYRKFAAEAVAIVHQMKKTAKEHDDGMIVDARLLTRLTNRCGTMRGSFNANEAMQSEQALARLQTHLGMAHEPMSAHMKYRGQKPDDAEEDTGESATV